MGSSSARPWKIRGGRPTLGAMKKLLFVAVVLGLAAFAVKKLQDA